MPSGDKDIAKKGIGLNTRFTRETAAENGRKGALGKRVNSRKRKLMAELLREALSQEVKTRAGETITHEIGVIRGLILKAEQGEAKAVELILKMLGQMPKEEITASVSFPVIVDDLIPRKAETGLKRGAKRGKRKVK